MTDIKLENLTKFYGSGDTQVAAVNDISLSIAGGEFFFLLGPSGCGKSTLLRMVAGLITPTNGRILFNDEDVTAQPTEQRNTAMVFQNYALWPHMTVTQNVEFGPKMQGCDKAKRQNLAQANLLRVQMESYARRKPNQLSGGQQQRVALARALAAQAHCLLLDEPLSNLDARLRQHMRTEILELVKSTGATALYVTHDQAEALSMADRIAVMDAGKVVQIGTPQELYERPATRFVADFLGEANFIAGTITAGGTAMAIQTAAGLIPCRKDRPLAAGASVTCCVRPERIAIVPASAQAGGPSDDWARLSAKIVASTYLGSMRQYTCALADRTLWRVVAMGSEAAALPVGAGVQLALRATDVSALTI